MTLTITRRLVVASPETRGLPNGMSMKLELAGEFAGELATVETAAELQAALNRTVKRLGFDHFALSLERRSTGTIGPVLLLHDYPEEWAKVYTAFELAGRDPVRRASDRTVIGFRWSTISSLVPLTRGDRQMLAVGRECGLADGYTVPRHLPGLASGTCTFVVSPRRNLPAQCLPIAELIGALALSCALSLVGTQRYPLQPRLSDRQRECLIWSARGKTAAETAIILGISTETVIQHLRLARERYEVHCRQSLILSALFDGVIGFADVFRMPRTVSGEDSSGQHHTPVPGM
jgi:DNA-binding CsgD family transcriptional regulator